MVRIGAVTKRRLSHPRLRPREIQMPGRIPEPCEANGCRRQYRSAASMPGRRPHWPSCRAARSRAGHHLPAAHCCHAKHPGRAGRRLAAPRYGLLPQRRPGSAIRALRRGRCRVRPGRAPATPRALLLGTTPGPAHSYRTKRAGAPDAALVRLGAVTESPLSHSRPRPELPPSRRTPAPRQSPPMRPGAARPPGRGRRPTA